MNFTYVMAVALSLVALFASLTTGSGRIKARTAKRMRINIFLDSKLVAAKGQLSAVPLAGGVKEFVTFLHQRCQSTVSRSFKFKTGSELNPNGKT